MNTSILQNEEIVVLFEEPLKVAAEETAGIYPVIKAQLEKTLGWKVNFRPAVLLIKDSKTFEKMAGSNLIVAFAVPQKDLIVIDYSKMKTHPFTIEITLKHELCHLLLHDHIKGKALPSWLDEGIAQWVSGGIAEIIMDRKHATLDEAVLTGKHIRISALTRGFPKDRESLMLAYEASRSLVEYMINTYGIEEVLMALTHLKAGDETAVAISKGLSISLDELERGWHNHLKKKITWALYIINNLYEILFFFAALILVYGFIRGLMKKRAYKDEEEEAIF